MAASSLRIVSSVFVLCFALFLGTTQAQLGANATNDNRYITWQDLEFGGEATRDSDGHGTRIIYVAKSGHGHSTTVQGAVDMVPENNKERVKIVIFSGTYRERVYIPPHKPYISFIGNPNYPTVITYNTKASDRDGRGREIGTFGTATVDVEADYFAATGITIQNTVVAGEGGVGMQAVALKLSGDNAFLYNTRILGSQDTLLDLKGRHYFYKCYIEGLVDFICGEATSLFQDCELHSTAKRSGGIAAHRRNSPDINTGFSFVNCTVTGTGRILLGRAWGPYSRTVYSHCYLDGIIDPVGWNDWGLPERRETVFFGEAQNRGSGAWNRRRVPWAKRLTPSQAKPFLDTNFIDGEQWLQLNENASPQFNCLCC